MNKVQILMRLVRSLDIWHWPLLLATTWVSFRYIPSSHVTYQSTHVLPSTTSTALNYCRTFNVIKRPSNTVHLTNQTYAPTQINNKETKETLSLLSTLTLTEQKKNGPSSVVSSGSSGRTRGVPIHGKTSGLNQHTVPRRRRFLNLNQASLQFVYTFFCVFVFNFSLLVRSNYYIHRFLTMRSDNLL